VNEGELDAAVAELGFPCVTKPIDSGGGKGLSAGLRVMGAVRQF
jgi:formate-dependent phosphoribosylglycinamide formyltransferase (GAR transformylase)